MAALDPAAILAVLETRLQVPVGHDSHAWLSDSVTIAVAAVERATHNPDVLGGDESVERGATQLAERVFHDPATRSRSVDAFGDPQFTGQIVPADLVAELAWYWQHVPPAPDPDDESEWTGRGFA